jgi:hypothetical protein
VTGESFETHAKMTGVDPLRAPRFSRRWPVVFGAALAVAQAGMSPRAAIATTLTSKPPFVASARSVTAAEIHFTWRPGCPVGPTSLRVLHLSYMGFDHRSHVGEIIVNTAVVSEVEQIFQTLYVKNFPIHSMEPEDAFKGSDPASMAADNTSGFNCRYAVSQGPRSWSVHAYGEAIDVNPVENPYLEGGTVQPSAGVAYRNRLVVRPGMAESGGSLVSVFAREGWFWGGRWSGTPDYQHFSATGG